MILRDKCTPQQLEAHCLLDDAKAGLPVTPTAIAWALRQLGEIVD
jgi:hypothetical protein